MIDLRSQPVAVPRRPIFSGLGAAAAALIPFWLGIPVTVWAARTWGPKLLEHYVPGGLEASPSVAYTLLARSIGVASAATILFALYCAILFWLTRRLAQRLWGRACVRNLAKWRAARALAWSMPSLKSQLGAQQRLHHAVEVDAADFVRPAHFSSIILGIAVGTIAAFGLAYSTQVRFMPELNTHLVWVALGGLPALAWFTTASLSFGTGPMLLVLWFGTALVFQLFMLSTPEVLVFLARRPAALASVGGWFFLSWGIQLLLFFALFLRRRKVKVLVLSDQGLRLYQLFMGKAKPLSGNFFPQRWVGLPGPVGESWRFESDGVAPIQVIPSDPGVGPLFQKLTEMDRVPEFRGEGGFQTPVDEILAAPVRRLALLAAWVFACAGLLVPMAHRSLVLRLGPIREMTLHSEGIESDAKLEAAARASMEKIGPNFASVGLLFRALESQDLFKEADELLPIVDRLEKQVWVPGLAVGSPGYQLCVDARRRKAQRERFLQASRKGWEPRGLAFAPYRMGLASLSGAWGTHSTSDVRRGLRNLRRAILFDGRNPASRVLYAMGAYYRPDLFLEEGALQRGSVPTGSAVKEYVERQIKAFEELWKLLEPLEDQPDWAGAKLKGRLPDRLLVEVLGALLRSRAYYGEPVEDEARAFKKVLNSFEAYRFIPVMGTDMRITDTARFLEAPPKDLSEAMRAWPGWKAWLKVSPRSIGLERWLQALYVRPETLEDRLRKIPGTAPFLTTPERVVP